MTPFVVGIPFVLKERGILYSVLRAHKKVVWYPERLKFMFTMLVEEHVGIAFVLNLKK